MKPKVSVITTVLNCEKYLSESISSILDQTFHDFEFIIVNDGSTDNTEEIIKEHAAGDKRIVYINNPKNLGRVASLNIALDSSNGKYIALNDADDISLPTRLEKQFRFLESNPDYVLVGTNIVVTDESGQTISNPLRPEKNLEAKFSLLFRCTFANPSIMFLKKVLDENNIRYEERFLHAEDFRIISLISRHGKVSNLREKLLRYRRHSYNNSSVNYELLDSGSTIITKENILGLGINVSCDQAYRIRKLISSKGINAEYLHEDVSLVFEIIKKFQNINSDPQNKEVMKTLKRMMNWIGRRNLVTKPEFRALFISILTYYYKRFIFTSNLKPIS